MKNWTIGKRITVGGGVLCALLALVGGIAHHALSQVREDAAQLKEDVMPGAIYSANFILCQTENLIRTLRYSQTRDAELRKKLAEEMAGVSKRMSEIVQGYEKTMTTEEARQIFARVIGLRGQYQSARAEFMKQVDAGSTDAA